MERKNRSLDILKTLGGLAATGIVLSEVSKLAFNKKTKKEVGNRDSWECCGVDGMPCIHTYLSEDKKPASFQDGKMVTAAHFKDKHHHTRKKGGDDNPDNGRILCTLDHAFEEIQRDNTWGARKLLNMGVYTWDHEKTTGEQEHVELGEIPPLYEMFKDHLHEQLEEKVIRLDQERLESIRSALGGGKRRRV